uniref:Uncharacterized protein n=1 Tax=Rhizophora mucronata TaxID=61149 RepID=A0A2P2PSH3_RHIMU
MTIPMNKLANIKNNKKKFVYLFVIFFRTTLFFTYKCSRTNLFVPNRNLCLFLGGGYACIGGVFQDEAITILENYWSCGLN